MFLHFFQFATICWLHWLSSGSWSSWFQQMNQIAVGSQRCRESVGTSLSKWLACAIQFFHTCVSMLSFCERWPAELVAQNVWTLPSVRRDAWSQKLIVAAANMGQLWMSFPNSISTCSELSYWRVQELLYLQGRLCESTGTNVGSQICQFDFSGTCLRCRWKLCQHFCIHFMSQFM